MRKEDKFKASLGSLVIPCLIFSKNKNRAGVSLVVEHLLSFREILSSVPKTLKEKGKEGKEGSLSVI